MSLSVGITKEHWDIFGTFSFAWHVQPLHIYIYISLYIKKGLNPSWWSHLSCQRINSLHDVMTRVKTPQRGILRLCIAWAFVIMCLYNNIGLLFRTWFWPGQLFSALTLTLSKKKNCSSQLFLRRQQWPSSFFLEDDVLKCSLKPTMESSCSLTSE